MDWIVAIIVAVAAAALGAAGGYLYRKQAGEKKIGRTEEYAKNLLEDAQRKADEKKKETILEAKEEVLRLKTELDRECRERRAEVQRSERRILQREESLDKKQDALETREEALGKKQNELQKMQEDIENDKQRQVAEMERIAGMTQDEACQMLVSRIQGTARVVNYAGLVRGETQRIIKLEGAGLPQDGMIEDVASFAAFAARLNRLRFRPTRIFRSIMISAFRCPSRSMKSRSKNKLPPNA